MHLETPDVGLQPYAARRMKTTPGPHRARSCRPLRLATLGAVWLVGLLHAAQAAAPPRAESLAKFDAGYAQCEQRFPEMRGLRDKTYAAVYRLRLDDALAADLKRTRQGAPYKSQSQRATRALARNAAASEVSTRLDRQCQGLKRELAR